MADQLNQSRSSSLYKGATNDTSENPFSSRNRTDSDINFYQYATVDRPPNQHLTIPKEAHQSQLQEFGSSSNDLTRTYSNISDAASMNSYEMNEGLVGASGAPLNPIVNSPYNTSNETGARKAFMQYKRGSKIFLTISIVSAILIIILESYMYAVINIHKKAFLNERFQELSIYLSLFVFASFYQVGLTIFGLHTKNMLLLTSLCIFYILMLVYTGLQYSDVTQFFTVGLTGVWRNATKGTNIATIAVLAATMISQAYLIFFVLRNDVSWFQYKKIGGDLTIRRMYQIFQIHRSLLIFDFFFFIGFTVQFLVMLVRNKTSVEFILTVCVLPLTIILLFLSDVATTRELVSLSIVTIAFFLGGCAYVLFKMIRLYTKYDSVYNIGLKPGEDFPGRKSLITFGVSTLILLLATIIIEISMVLNYNKGLLPIVSKSWKWIPGNTTKDNRYRKTDDIYPGGRRVDNEALKTNTSLDDLNPNGTSRNESRRDYDDDDESILID